MERLKIGTPTIERIENYTFYSPDGCWYWLGFLNKRGYGRIRINNKSEFVHRVNFTIHKGIIPDGLSVCHHCDNPSCINPNHLFIGTQKDNSLDMVRKGRHKIYLGESNCKSKLTNDDVEDIRSYKGKKMGQSLAKKYNVHVCTISRIQNKVFWKHL